MEPGLRSGERLIVRCLPPARDPARGSLVVFEPPCSDPKHFVKRVIGLPGDLLKAEDGCLFLNGERQSETYLGGQPSIPGLDERWELRLKADRYFLMGDNRFWSTDSRHYGPIHRESIWGRALLRLWPPGTLGRKA